MSAATCAVLMFIAAPQARAADGDIVLPLYDLPAATHTPVARGLDQSEASRTSAGSARASAVATTRPTASFSLVEMPPEAALPGSGYKRPHHALGYRWQAAESWLRDHGFDAQTCFLPMVRMHTKLSASGASGTLWVYGRCTFR